MLLALFRRIDRTVFDPYICVEKYWELIPNDVSEDRRLVFEWTGNRMQDLMEFRRLLKKHKIDLLHSWDYKSNYMEALASKVAGVKYLYTKKNDAWSRPWKMKSFFSTHIAYDNPTMKDRFFNSFVFRNRTTFIPHGVDTDVFRPFKKAPSNFFNIGCIGNIGNNKNQLFIIKALKELPENVNLHLYGKEEKEYRARIDAYIDSNDLKHRVHFYGYIANEKIPSILKKMDLFVLASFQEGLPISILEALACGVPVLSSDSGGGARYLLDVEHVFSLNDIKELVEKVEKLYGMEETEKQVLIENGIHSVFKNHTIEKEVLAYDELYKNLIGL